MRCKPVTQLTYMPNVTQSINLLIVVMKVAFLDSCSYQKKATD